MTWDDFAPAAPVNPAAPEPATPPNATPAAGGWERFPLAAATPEPAPTAPKAGAPTAGWDAFPLAVEPPAAPTPAPAAAAGWEQFSLAETPAGNDDFDLSPPTVAVGDAPPAAPVAPVANQLAQTFARATEAGAGTAGVRDRRRRREAIAAQMPQAEADVIAAEQAMAAAPKGPYGPLPNVTEPLAKARARAEILDRDYRAVDAEARAGKPFPFDVAGLDDDAERRVRGAVEAGHLAPAALDYFALARDLAAGHELVPVPPQVEDSLPIEIRNKLNGLPNIRPDAEAAARGAYKVDGRKLIRRDVLERLVPKGIPVEKVEPGFFESKLNALAGGILNLGPEAYRVVQGARAAGARIGEAVTGMPAAVRNFAGDTAAEPSAVSKGFGQFAKETERDVAGNVRRTEADLRELLPTRGDVGDKILQGVGGIGADVGALAAGGPAAFVGSFSTRTAGETYAHELAARPGDPSAAMMKGIGAGLFTALTAKLMPNLGEAGAKSLARRVTDSFVHNAPQLVLQGAGVEAIAKAGTGESVDWGTILKDSLANALVFAVGHGLITAPEAAATQAPKPSPENAAKGSEVASAEKTPQRGSNAPESAQAAIPPAANDAKPAGNEMPPAANETAAKSDNPPAEVQAPAGGQYEMQGPEHFARMLERQKQRIAEVDKDPVQRKLGVVLEELMDAHDGIVREPAAEAPPARTNPADAADPTYDQAVQITRDVGRASVSLLQRRMNMRYSQAADLVERMKRDRIVEGKEGGLLRVVTPAPADVHPLGEGVKPPASEASVAEPAPQPAQPVQRGEEGQQQRVEQKPGGELGQEATVARGTQAPETVTDAAAAAKPEAAPEPAPKTGRLDDVEAWARRKLAEMGATGFRGGIPVDPIADTKRLALYGVIGAARIAKGAVKFAEWSRDVAREIPELAGAGREQLMRVFAAARRIHRMDEQTRAEYVVARLTVPSDRERALTRVRRLTGQADTSRAVTELQSLRASMRAQARGADAGFRAGKAEGLEEGQAEGRVKLMNAMAYEKQRQAGIEGMKRELARIVKENLPPELHRRFLDDVAQVRTPGQVALAIRKGSELLADHDVRTAMGEVERLTGKLELDVYGPKQAPVQGPKEKPPAGADAVPHRRVNLNELPEPYRAAVRRLIHDAKGVKERLTRLREGGGSIEEKQAVVDDFRRIDREIREQVADYRGTRETVVGGRKVLIADLKRKILDRVDPAGEAVKPDGFHGEASRDAGLARLAVRRQLNPETILTDLGGDYRGDNDVYRATVGKYTEARDAFHAEERRFEEEFGKAMDAAGIPLGSAALERFRKDAVPVVMPNAGRHKLTRQQMVGLLAALGDEKTLPLIQRGVRWNERSNPRAKGVRLTVDDIESLRRHLTPAQVKLVDEFHRVRDVMQLGERGQAAKIELAGSAPDLHKGHFPQKRNIEQTPEKNQPKGWKGRQRKVVENISAFEERTADTRAPLFLPEFIDDAFDHVSDVARVIHVAEPVRAMSVLLEDPDVRRAVARRYGDSMNDQIGRMLDDAAMPDPVGPRNAVERFSQWATRQIARKSLPANPSPILKNALLGPIALMTEFDAGDYLHGLAHALDPKVGQRMREHSNLFWARERHGMYAAHGIAGGDRVLREIRLTLPEAGKAAVLDLAKLKPIDFFRHIGAATDALPFMQAADGIPFRVAWAAAERFVERTMPGAAAAEKLGAVKDKFHQATGRTQNGNSPLEMSYFASQMRENPALAGVTLFTSDSNKKLNMLARFKSAPAAVRAKMLAVVALNAIGSAAITAGLGLGAAKLGATIAGRDLNDEEKAKAKERFLATALRGILSTSYGGDKLADQFTGAKSDSRITSDVLDTIGDLARDVGQWATSEEGSKAAETKYDRVMRLLERVATSDLTGNAALPLYFRAKQVQKAAQTPAPDPRVEAGKAEEKRQAKVRDTLPANVRALTTERAKLQGIERDQLTPEEKTRLARLDGFGRAYQDKLKELSAAVAAGDQAAANRVRRELHDTAAGVDRAPVDPRVIDAQDKEHRDRQLRESLPKEVRDLASERSRIVKIAKSQRTREERVRLYRLGQFGEFYELQVKRIRLARERGDKALEQRAREALLARAKQLQS